MQLGLTNTVQPDETKLHFAAGQNYFNRPPKQ